jgi:hypothetical protein
VAALTKLIGSLREAIADAEGSADIDDRLSHVLDDATGRFPALLTGVSLGAGGTLDPDVLLGRAQKLPGDREGQISAALVELVAYLEFEIKNHPQIPDPDDLLRGLADERRLVGAA